MTGVQTCALPISLLCHISLLSQQIDIPRIELMPDFPQPYEMRNWKEVARKYDSLVFNLDASGEYLPLVEKIGRASCRERV